MDKQTFFSVIDGIKPQDAYIYLILKNGRRYYTTWNKLEDFRNNEDLVLEVDQTNVDHLTLLFGCGKNIKLTSKTL